jgi:hypothetical protein
MEVVSYTPLPLYPGGKLTRVSVEEAEGVPEPVWTLWKGQKFFLCGKSTKAFNPISRPYTDRATRNLIILELILIV